MNLLEIAEGWLRLYQPTPEIQLAASARLAHCESCPEKRPNAPLIAGLLRNTVPETKAIYAYSCRACGCFLAPKAHSPASTCPLNKWGAMPGSEDHFSPSLSLV